jgi:hypothetical protein
VFCLLPSLGCQLPEDRAHLSSSSLWWVQCPARYSVCKETAKRSPKLGTQDYVSQTSLSGRNPGHCNALEVIHATSRPCRNLLRHPLSLSPYQCKDVGTQQGLSGPEKQQEGS